MSILLIINSNFSNLIALCKINFPKNMTSNVKDFQALDTNREVLGSTHDGSL